MKPRGPLLPPAGAPARRDLAILFSTRAVRMFAYGLVSVILALYLAGLGFDAGRIGLLLSLALLGDTAMSFLITTSADRVGRRRMLVLGAFLMLVAGIPLAVSVDYLLILAALTVGVLSPSGNEVGPFLALEQAALSETIAPESRTAAFAWYNLAGSVSAALGALAGGWGAQLMQGSGVSKTDSYRAVVLGYSALGLALAVLFSRLSPGVESPRAASPTGRLGLGPSRGIVARLAALFSLDAFGGGFVVQSVMAYWFHLRFGIGPGAIGSLFFGANLLAALSALTAASIAKRIGLVRTMVFTHLPSNLLLVLVPFMPTLPSAIAVLLARFAISQMDVPTRQSYTMAVVRPEERSAAAGITGMARTTGASISPAIAGPLLGDPATAGLVFALAGGIKTAYDLLLYRAFKRRDPEQERK